MADDNAAPVWSEQVASIQDTGLKETLSKFESQDKFFETIGYKPPAPVQVDWREQLKDEDAKKFAAEATDINAFAKRALDARRAMSNAIIRPGKDATPEQISAYRKSMGIPEKAELYEFPTLPKGVDLTDEMKAERKEWGDRFHKLGVSNDQAKQLWELVVADNAKSAQATIDADKAFTKAQDEALKADWKGDYDKNKTLGNRAFRDLAEKAGLNVEELTKIETKDGRFLLDNANIVRMFAAIGREMAEGTLGPALNETEIDTVNDQIKTVRGKMAEAQGRGDSKEANKLYATEQALIAKRDGNQPVVGAGGRGV